MESKVNDKSDKPDKPIRVLWDVKTPMRDGTLLSSEVYLPYEEGAFPAILQRTPYGNEEIYCVNVGKFFAQHGYAFVFQDVRGRGDSDGIFDEYNEGNDGYDTIEWIAAQPWCNGNVGMRGGSYEGAVQWDAARKNPPYLKAIIPQALVPDLMETIPFSNGIPRLENLQWLFFVSGRSNQCNILTAIDWDHILFHLPLKTMDKKIGKTLSSWQKILEHPNLDEFWKSNRASKEECSQMNIPMLFISGWHDDSLRGTLWAYQKVLENTPKPDQIYLLIGPWNHGGTGAPKQQLRGIDYGPQAVLNMREVHLKWFDYWLKGIKNEVSEWKRTQLFLMGENKWQNFDVALPSIEKGKLELYLNSDGNAQSSKGTGKLQRKAPTQETKDIFTYDPHNPVPDYPVLNLYGEEVDGSFEINYVTERNDVLVYTTEPLDEAITIFGSPVLEFYGSSDCVDTDWFATIAEVTPEGKAISFGAANFGISCIRARYRDSLSEPKLMTPHQVYKFKLSIDPLFNTFKKGNRIQLIVTSSAFPTYARNLNTGERIGFGTEIKIAHNSIHHGGQLLSKLILPVKPR